MEYFSKFGRADGELQETHHRAHLAAVLVLTSLASLLLSDAAWACAYMSDQALDAVAAARIYWLASKVIGFAIVGFEVIRKRYALSAAMAAFTVYFFSWINPGMGDCGAMTVQTSQTALAVMVLLLTFELFSIGRSWSGQTSLSAARALYVAISLAALTIIYATVFFGLGFTPYSWSGLGFTPYSWRTFSPALVFIESVLGMTAFAGLAWGLGRPIYRFIR